MQSNEVKWLPLKCLQPNTGQVPGLPGNPRQWTEGDVKRIARSLKETPELFVARPIIVLPFSTPGADDCYVILGGNLRSEGARRNKMQTVPCYILPAETPVAKLKEIVIKDNGSFGAWDYDALGNEWSELPLPEWGVPVWATTNISDLSELGDDGDLTADKITKPGESISGYTAISFLFPVDKAGVVNEYIKREGKDNLAEKIIELCQEQEAK